MRKLTYILPVCLFCLTVLGQQKTDRSTLRDNPVPSQAMLEKYKQHEGWVKLTDAIHEQGAIAAKLQSQINAQNEVIQAKTRAKKDASADRARLNQLHKSLAPLNSKLAQMEKERKVIESEIRLQESNKK
jgi:2,4-dienoyl-CoA reductase-like NADH-dependent reductase (Old Yellow Enzyme family)